jgi:hypothetical protein
LKAFTNTTGFGYVPNGRKKRVQDYRCRDRGSGWLLGIFELLARLQDIWDGDENVYYKVSKQPMAKTLKNPWTWHPRNQNSRTRFHQQCK